MGDGKVAFITGASRGIGKACALELAAAGFRVAITARTVKEGKARDHSSTVRDVDLTPLPGSLTGTVELIEKEGGTAMAVPADLLDGPSLGAAVTSVLERWGRIDVVVHNGRYIGPGHMDLFLDTPIELIRKQVEGNFFAPLTINQLVLPQMVERGEGIIVNITSGSGYSSPTKPAGQGGWGLGYGTSKGAFHRVAGLLAVELGDQGIQCFNVQPGFIATERIGQDMAKFGIENNGAPVEVMGKVVRWLCTEPGAAELNGKNIEAQFFCHERGLLPGWAGPRPLDDNMAMALDPSAAELQRLEEELAARHRR